MDAAGIGSDAKLIFHIFGVLAELERKLIRERTRAGLSAARARGRKDSGPKLLDAYKQPYVTMIPKSNAVEYRGQREWAEQLGQRLNAAMWTARSSGPGSQGERIHDWACLKLSEPAHPGMARWSLIRRDPEQSNDHSYWLACGPDETTVTELVQVADACWQAEECFAQAKGEVGLDHYGVRAWAAWHRSVTRLPDEILLSRQGPEYIILDNGPELTSHWFDQWANHNGIALDYIERGNQSRTRVPTLWVMESFNGRFRDECLNSHCAQRTPASLDDARQTTEARRIDYNQERPHSPLSYRTPEEVHHQLFRCFDGSIAAGFSN